MTDGTATDLFAGGGEMGALMRSTDWSKTRLGPLESWSKSLRTMLGVVLGSRFPMLLWWGPDLLHLYNDAYRPILRDKHPRSLAAPAAEIWAEVWDVAGPMASGVQQGGGATWTEDLQLFIKSGAMAEETYFTFSYSPVPGDDGNVGSVTGSAPRNRVRLDRDDLAAESKKRANERVKSSALGVLLPLPYRKVHCQLPLAGAIASVNPSPGERPAFGRLLRQWRSLRGLSQLALAQEVGTTTRHLSYIDNGRSRPGRDGCSGQRKRSTSPCDRATSCCWRRVSPPSFWRTKSAAQRWTPTGARCSA